MLLLGHGTGAGLRALLVEVNQEGTTGRLGPLIPWGQTAMRPATTVALAVLLLVVVAAFIIQLAGAGGT